jgi:nitrite reductase/ring-hydroxylating ferredoxin subunit
MLTKEENDLLTQTGPGTPCGDFMRRYWQPVALAEELPADGPPVPVRLLGEDLVLFRDGQGRLGLLGRWCSHRGTDLARGWIEPEGLRCSFHEWMYDVGGHCLEMPWEPPGPETDEFRAGIQHRAYPCREAAGLIFAYLGPGEPPLLPAYEFLGVPEAQRRSTKYFQECNYLQGSEGSIDPLQLWFLQELLQRQVDGSDQSPPLALEPAVEAEATDFGVRLAAVKRTGADASSVQFRSFMLPSLAGMAAVGMDGYVVHWHVPIDDLRHWRFVVAFRRDAPMTDLDARRNGVDGVPGYRMDRNQIRIALGDPEASYIAYTTLIAESQGPIYDRTQEYLTEADRGVVLMRSVMYGAIQDVQEGADPAHVVRDPDANRFEHIVVRDEVLPTGQDWRTLWDRQPS